MLKKETRAEFARKVLLENLRGNKGNVKKTPKEMEYSRNTIYLALKKKSEGDLKETTKKRLSIQQSREKKKPDVEKGG
jgi:DNA-binding NtrC family response regulator